MHTSWEKKGKKTQIVVSRYGVAASLDSAFIADYILTSISALLQYGYIMDTIACNEASKNRSTLKSLAIIRSIDFLEK